jgi:hypothetical protein
MKTFQFVLVGVVLSSCAVQAPPLPQQQLPRQQLPREKLAQPEITPRASALTPGMVVKHIQKGKTTQAEIMETFGPPDMVTRSGPGEMWGYDKVSREVAEAATGASADARMGAHTEAGGRIGAGGLGLVGGAGGGVIGGVLGGISGAYGQAAGQSQQQSLQQNQEQSRRTESTTTVFLLIYFSDKGVVTDYRLSATKF